MAIILFGLANGRTVSLSHLASQFPGKALHASNYRRLQHFFKQVQFDEATRLATMAIILFGLANGRTVSLSHLASQFPGKALHASNYRRLQHFFKQVQFDEAVVARFIVSLFNIKGPVILAVDRTNSIFW